MSAGLTRDAPIAGIAAELRVRERSVRGGSVMGFESRDLTAGQQPVRASVRRP
jgi:hypothetical protein